MDKSFNGTALQGRDPASVPVSSPTTSTSANANSQRHSKRSHKPLFSSDHQHHAQQTSQEWTFGFSAHPFIRLLSAESQPFMIITPSFVLIALTFLSSASPTFSHPSLNSCASLAPHLLVSLFLSRILRQVSSRVRFKFPSALVRLPAPPPFLPLLSTAR